MSTSKVQSFGVHEGASLGATLEGANVKGAILWDANFYGTDLRGADFKGACLELVELQMQTSEVKTLITCVSELLDSESCKRRVFFPRL